MKTIDKRFEHDWDRSPPGQPRRPMPVEYVELIHEFENVMGEGLPRALATAMTEAVTEADLLKDFWFLVEGQNWVKHEAEAVRRHDRVCSAFLTAAINKLKDELFYARHMFGMENVERVARVVDVRRTAEKKTPRKPKATRARVEVNETRATVPGDRTH